MFKLFVFSVILCAACKTGRRTGESEFLATHGLTIGDVEQAIADVRARFQESPIEIGRCMTSGAAVGWSSLMQRYYCEFPKQGADNQNIRECFTASVRGISPYSLRSYTDAYHYCSSDGLRHERPMRWIRETPLQDRVFQAVMIDKETDFPTVAGSGSTGSGSASGGAVLANFSGCELRDSRSSIGWRYSISINGTMLADERWSSYGGKGFGTDDLNAAQAFFELVKTEGRCSGAAGGAAGVGASPAVMSTVGDCELVDTGVAGGWKYVIRIYGMHYGDSRWSSYGGKDNGTDDAAAAQRFFALVQKEGRCAGAGGGAVGVGATSAGTIVGDCELRDSGIADIWRFMIKVNDSFYTDTRWSSYGGQSIGTNDAAGAQKFFALIQREGNCGNTRTKASYKGVTAGVCELRDYGAVGPDGWRYTIRVNSRLYKDARWSSHGGDSQGTNDAAGAKTLFTLLQKERSC